ncbi:MAG: TPM domain-containing protein [Leptospira sp.]|nr:TPM domain-containing protein [Leptospira sp.]
MAGILNHFRFPVWLVFVFIFKLSFVSLSARDIPILTERVTDEVNILTVDEWSSLRDRLLSIESQTSAQIFVYIIPSLEGETIESYAMSVAEKSGIGQKGKDNGVLLLLSTGDRKVRIEVGYGLEDTVTDVYCNRIIRNVMIPRFKEGNLTQGVMEGTDAIIAILLGNADSNPNLQNEHPNGLQTVVFQEETLGNHFVVLILVLIFSFIGFFFLKEWKYFSNHHNLQKLYGALVLISLFIFAWQALTILSFFCLFAFNIYLLYYYEGKYSYPISIGSLLLWIPILKLIFAWEYFSIYLLVGIFSGILLAFKFFNDDVVLVPLRGFAKRLQTGLGGLFVHFLAVISLSLPIFLISLGYSVQQSLSIYGIVLLSIYGLGFRILGYRLKYYLFGIGGWFVYELLLAILPISKDSNLQISFATMIQFFQTYLFIVPAFLIALYWEVGSWKVRILKYAAITILWTCTYHIPYFLGWDEVWDSFLFFVFYFLTLLIHFFVLVAKESGSGGGGYSSSSSSSSSYSSSGSSYSSGSSSSSGGGGGSFGGGGSSGSW